MTGADVPKRRCIVAYVPDLMDRSRFAQVQADVLFVRSPEDLIARATDADVIVMDLGRPGVLEAMAQVALDVPSVGYASHVERATIETARAVGVNEVLPRSKFFAQIVAVLG